MSAIPPEKDVFQPRRCHMAIRIITSKKLEVLDAGALRLSFKVSL